MHMKKLLPLLYATPLILISSALGYGVSIFTNLGWPSASLFSAAALLMVGTWIFQDDANLMAEEPGKSSAEVASINSDIRKNNIIGYSLVIALVIFGLWLQQSI